MGYEEQKIEGRNAVLEAFRSGKTIDKLFVLDGCQDGPVRTIVREARKHDTIINFVDKERLDQLSETKKHQGVIAVAAAYEYAEAGVRPILEEHPSIEVVIDLHRDGVGEDTHLVTEVNGKPTAQIMFFNGLSRTKDNGDIAYLPNPYIQDNLAFSLQMKLAAEQMYPGFTRRIFLRGYRYSLHMRPKSLLIEAGAQTNTVEEMRNAMELLAVTLQKVIVENP